MLPQRHLFATKWVLFSRKRCNLLQMDLFCEPSLTVHTVILYVSPESVNAGPLIPDFIRLIRMITFSHTNYNKYNSPMVANSKSRYNALLSMNISFYFPYFLSPPIPIPAPKYPHTTPDSKPMFALSFLDTYYYFGPNYRIFIVILY